MITVKRTMEYVPMSALKPGDWFAYTDGSGFGVRLLGEAVVIFSGPVPGDHTCDVFVRTQRVDFMLDDRYFKIDPPDITVTIP